MTRILIIGAGRSTSSLISYMLQHAAANQWHITVADADKALAEQKTAAYSQVAAAVQFDVTNAALRGQLISSSDFVISMLPAFMHGEVARDCVRLGRHMATASYVSADMKALNEEAISKNLLLLNESGLDPGIDHASAMKVIHHIQANGGHITSFKSFCGGLVAPESNDNPWGYKFSWNPRNVVMAGQGTAQYIESSQLKCIPYSRLFMQTDTVNVEGYGAFDAYANRDSISYEKPYGLEGINTILRGTLRMPGYCKAWNVFVKLGILDESCTIHHANELSYTDLIASYLPEGPGTVKDRLVKLMGAEMDDAVMEKLEYLELFSHKPIRRREATPALLIQDLLEEKWMLRPGDKDMIVMQHQFDYELGGVSKRIDSSLVVIGDDEVNTAMAKTVGLPLAICVKNFLTGKFKLYGVQIPTVKEIYEPLLDELETLGIHFIEKEVR